MAKIRSCGGILQANHGKLMTITDYLATGDYLHAMF